MIKSYKELTVWQKSLDLAKRIYKATDKFPKSEIYGLTSQIRRAAVSIPSNLAEGFVRSYRKEFAQFTAIAFGSGAELETQLLLAKELGYIKEGDFRELNSLIDEIMRMLNTLITKLKTDQSLVASG